MGARRDRDTAKTEARDVLSGGPAYGVGLSGGLTPFLGLEGWYQGARNAGVTLGARGVSRFVGTNARLDPRRECGGRSGREGVALAIAWDPSLSIGVESIDRQHRELFHRIDRLLEASRSHTTAHEVGALLEFLAAYVREHFRTEEALMEAVGYPAAADHRAEHLAFARELVELRAQHAQEGGSALLVVRVTSRATSWLREHIYRADKQLGRFVGEKRG